MKISYYRNKADKALQKSLTSIHKNCKLCGNPRYANTSWCIKHYREREKQKKLDKIERHKRTKSYEKEMIDKLIRINDRLFQELGRRMYKTCYFGHLYSCLHHLVRKSQSLFLRYEIKNAIPVCKECHCSIHLGENTILEARFVSDKGDDWLKEIEAGKKVIVNDKLKFLKEKNIELNKLIQQYD